MLVIGKVCVCV